ncbi:MAG TPA: MmcQ/YjbR family DNA-binding protein [Acidimicrobiales bacterium]
MTDYADVPGPVVAELASICLGLPDAYQEQAWAGTRWRVRKRTFAHVVAVEQGNPPAYARATGADGPVVVVTFRSSGPELEALGHAGHPFFRPPWAPNVVGMVIDDGVDWGEVAELLTESYCVMAPKKLVALVDRPPADESADAGVDDDVGPPA